MILSRIFPKLEIEKISWDASSAKELIEKYKIAALPAFIFSKEIDQSLRYIRVKDKLILKEDHYFLNPQFFRTVYFPNREEKEGQLAIFMESLNPQDNHTLQQIFKIQELREALTKVHFPAQMEKQLPSPPMLSLQSSDQPNVLILKPQAPPVIFTSRKGPKEILEDKRQLCVSRDAPEKYWGYLLCRSEQIIKGNQQEDGWELCAQQTNLKTNQIKTCVADGKGAQFLLENISLTQTLKIKSTPCFLINNKWLINSADPAVVRGHISQIQQITNINHKDK